MTGKNLLENLQILEEKGNINVPIAFSHVYLTVNGIYFSHSTDGKIPYINIEIDEDFKILDD